MGTCYPKAWWAQDRGTPLQAAGLWAHLLPCTPTPLHTHSLLDILRPFLACQDNLFFWSPAAGVLMVWRRRVDPCCAWGQRCHQGRGQQPPGKTCLSPRQPWFPGDGAGAVEVPPWVRASRSKEEAEGSGGR